VACSEPPVSAAGRLVDNSPAASELDFIGVERPEVARLLPLCRCKAGAGFRNYLPASEGWDALRQIGWFRTCGPKRTEPLEVTPTLRFFKERNQWPCATGILILDNIGTVVYSNEAADHILNGKSAEAIP